MALVVSAIADTEKLCEDLEKLYESGEFSDVALVVEEQKIPVHKMDEGSYDNFLISGLVLDVSLIDRQLSEKQISFRLSCGPMFNDGGDSKSVGNSCSVPMKPKVVDKSHCFLDIRGEKPLLSLALSLPDLRKRLYNVNLLSKIRKELKSKLDKIDNTCNNHNHNKALDLCQSLVVDVLDYVATSAQKYIDLASSNYVATEDTNTLAPLLLKTCLREMELVLAKVAKIDHLLKSRKIYQKLVKILEQIEQLLLYELECWPKIFIWMLSGTSNKRVAYSIIEPLTIIYSDIDEEKGQSCGRVTTIYFHNAEDLSKKCLNSKEFICMTCKMDIVLWMGLQRHWDSDKSKYPEGFGQSTSEPRFVKTDQSSEFELRAHIFQGRFAPGADKSGLCDPFVRIVLGGQYRETRIIRKSLSPIWDETLVINKIVLFGGTDFVKDNPPGVLMEVFDKDSFGKSELVGRAMVEPQFSATRLSWFKVYDKFDVSAEILGALELSSQVSDVRSDGTIRRIPQGIKPKLVNYRIEIYFWGVRNLRKGSLFSVSVTRPRIVVECMNLSVTSDSLANAKKCLNFTNPVKMCEVVFPDESEYAPPICVKMIDCRTFGVNALVGTDVVSVSSFMFEPLTIEERNIRMVVPELSKMSDVELSSCVNSDTIESIVATLDLTKTSKEMVNKQLVERGSCGRVLCCCCRRRGNDDRVSSVSTCDSRVTFEEDSWSESDDFDWWTKFYASLDDTPAHGKVLLSNKYRLQVYDSELENQQEFNNFQDLIQEFPMYKGKRTGDELIDEENTTAIFKGSFKIYRWTPSNLEPGTLDKGVFGENYPSNTPLRYIVRVYCVRALNLRPKDLDGRSDPYLCVALNNGGCSNDKDNRVMGQVNPIFGRCFEFNGCFPDNHLLTVAIYDWDMATSDDLIGETRIDLENRFYSNHRGHCGLAEDYQVSGYCQWRDQQKPSQILDALCRKENIGEPEYGATSVRVAHNEFVSIGFEPSSDAEFDRQVLALNALRRWREVPIVGCRLVPEHVETRSLYNPNKPGIEQGKIQMWVDIFPLVDLPTPKPVPIAPRKPVAYELRVIVWNAENVHLDEDDFFTGEKKSDIFIKGWMIDVDIDGQVTDVHYRSLSGEGNFNWRFVFPFEYLSTENKIVTRRKKSIFEVYESDCKMPCRLTVQVWDNDTFSADEFLGTLSLELSRLPRGAKTSKKCDLKMPNKKTPVVNLFKTKRARGWYPFRNFDKTDKTDFFSGCVELELELLTREEAEKFPAGCGRDPPQKLPNPNRPETSFSIFSNPLRALKFALKVHKWRILKCLLLVFLVVTLVTFVYNLPGYGLKRILKIN